MTEQSIEGDLDLVEISIKAAFGSSLEAFTKHRPAQVPMSPMHADPAFRPTPKQGLSMGVPPWNARMEEPQNCVLRW